MNPRRAAYVVRGMSLTTTFALRLNGHPLVGDIYPILAALTLGRTRTVPLGAVVASRGAEPGDVVELVVSGRAGRVHHVGVVHATPQRDLQLSFAFVDPSDWVPDGYYVAPPRPEDVAALYRGEAPDIAALFQWGAHVPELRRAQAARRAVQAAVERNGALKPAPRDLWDRLGEPGARGVRQSVEALRRAMPPLVIDGGRRPESPRDLVREQASRLGREACVDHAVLTLGEAVAALQRGEVPMLLAEAALWALAASAVDDAVGAVTRAVQAEIPFNCYVAALAGVVEDDLAY